MIQAVWVGLLLVAAYASQLRDLVGAWFADADMSHGILVPIVAGYFMWQRRYALRNEPHSSTPAGLWMVLAGVLISFVSLPGNWTFPFRCSLLMVAVGCLLYMRGARWVKHLALPLALLLFMIPPPTFIYEAATFQLQLVASSIAEHALELMGHSVLREGNILELPGLRLSVVEACSGMRSIFSLAFFCVAYTKLVGERWWICLIVLPFTVPIAVLVNSGRIVSAGVFGSVDYKFATAGWHDAAGMISSLLGMALVVALHRVFTSVRHRFHDA